MEGNERGVGTSLRREGKRVGRELKREGDKLN